MIIEMGQADGRAKKRIIILGAHEEKREQEGKVIIV